MADKTKQKKKKSAKKDANSQRGYSIVVTLMLSLLIGIFVILIFTITTSMSVVKSVRDNTLVNFYSNLKIFHNLTESPEQFEANLPKLKGQLNAVLTTEELINEAVADIYVVNNKDKLVYTTLDKKTAEFSYQPASPKPLDIHKNSKYPIAKYTVVAVPKTFVNQPNTSYIVYLVVPKLSTDYRGSIVFQLGIFFFVIILIASVLTFFLIRSITKPLDTMEKTVSQIAKGDLSGRLDLTKYEEINKLVGSYNLMANALQRLYSSLEAQVNDRTRELKGAYAELQSTQAMMVHSEKMKSLGELVAGIMHEINNPINFIYGNMTHLGNYSHDLIEIIDEYTKFEPSLQDSDKNKVIEMKKTCDYDFLRTDMPDLIKSCKEGAERAKNIIQDLKSFSRMEEVSIKAVDLPAEIDTVLNILHNKIKNKAEVHKEYIEPMPKIEAFGGQLNQVFMNILDNAVGAIEKTGDIWIRINTDVVTRNMVIEVEDNGQGMDEDTKRKVFDPFFTTKPVGKGTGLGMSITYKIIKNHQGDIKVESTKGKGSKFIITLPLSIDRNNLKTGAVSGEEK